MKDKITVLISGDFCPTGRVENEILSNSKPEAVFGHALQIIKSADISIVNLECPLTTCKTRIRKIGPHLKAAPGTIEALTNAGFNVVTLANNHIYDYGQDGLAETLRICEDKGIDTVGAGLTLEHAQETYYKRIKGKVIAIVNFAENEFSSADRARGGASPMNIIDNVHQITSAEEKADFVLVVVHGGHEHYHYPSERMVKQYRFYAEHGASAIIAHHTHCVSGHEVFNGVPIFYSLGNFLFDSATTFSGWYEGHMVRLSIDGSVDYETIPYSQCKAEARVEIYEGPEKARMLEQIAEYSEVIQDQQRLREKWHAFVDENSLGYLSHLSMMGRYQQALLRRLRLLTLLFNKKKLIRMQNSIRCESHRDMCLQALEDLLS